MRLKWLDKSFEACRCVRVRVNRSLWKRHRVCRIFGSKLPTREWMSAWQSNVLLPLWELSFTQWAFFPAITHSILLSSLLLQDFSTRLSSEWSILMDIQVLSHQCLQCLPLWLWPELREEHLAMWPMLSEFSTSRHWYAPQPHKILKRTAPLLYSSLHFIGQQLWDII